MGKNHTAETKHMTI